MISIRTLVIVVLAGWCAGAAEAQPGSAAHDAATRLLANSAQLPPKGEPIKCGLAAVTTALHQRGTVLSGAAATMLRRPAMHTSIARTGFRVHFDTAGTNTPALLDVTGAPIPGTARAFVDSVFASLAYVAPFQTQGLGYGALPPDDTLNGGPEYDVFIMELGNMYGYTTPDGSPPDGGTATTFMTIDNDFAFVHPAANRGVPALHVTIAHELHHALQIGNYGYWQNDIYFYEITSTWMEDVLYPAVNDYYEYLRASWGHFRTPERAFTSNDLICYSRGIWGHYIAARYGRDMMRTTWEQIRSVRPLTAIDRALRTQGYDAPGAFAEWSLWNHFTGARSEGSRYYPDAAEYPLMTELPVEYHPPSREITGSLAPFASRYYQLMRPPDTMTVIVANVDLAAATAQAAGKDYAIDFRSARPNDTYLATPIGLFAHLGVTSPVHWASWFVVGDTVRRNVDPEHFAEGRAFPNPFLPGLHARVAMPVDGTDQVTGSVAVFSGGLDPVYTSGMSTSSWHLDRQMFFWDGKGMDGSVVPSGVYFYVIDLGERRVTGKIALVRR